MFLTSADLCPGFQRTCLLCSRGILQFLLTVVHHLILWNQIFFITNSGHFCTDLNINVKTDTSLRLSQIYVNNLADLKSQQFFGGYQHSGFGSVITMSQTEGFKGPLTLIWEQKRCNNKMARISICSDKSDQGAQLYLHISVPIFRSGQSTTTQSQSQTLCEIGTKARLHGPTTMSPLRMSMKSTQ